VDFGDTVRAGYNRIADAYLARRRMDGPDVRLLDRFAERVAPGSAILDAGCGAGDPITCKLGDYFRVTGVDFAETQLARAHRRIPKARFVCADLRRLPFRDGCFDAICSYYAIIHVPREDHADLLVNFARVLVPGGVALLCLGAGDLAYDCAEYFGVPMVWSHFDGFTNRQLVIASGLQIEWAELVEDDDTPNARHLFLLASKPGTAVC
jgi:SAM-dependent methyltransferase